MEIFNSDGFNSFRERYNDMRPELLFGNANYDPTIKFGFYLRSLEINNKTYSEEDIFNYFDGSERECNYNGYTFYGQDCYEDNFELTHENESSSLEVNLSSTYERTAESGYIYNWWCLCIDGLQKNDSRLFLGDFTLNLDDYAYPMYAYQFRSYSCLLDQDPGFNFPVDGWGPGNYCGEKPIRELTVQYVPDIDQQPPLVTTVYINGIVAWQWLENNVVYEGTTVQLSLEVEDPNGLDVDIKWRGGSGEGRLYSEWLPSDSLTSYTFTQEDVGGNVSMYYYIKNNDGVGVRWNSGDFFSDGTGEITEIDLYGLSNRIIFTVSE